MVALVCLVVLSLAGGAYFTSLFWRLARARSRRTGWPWASAGTLLTGIVAGLLFGLGVSLQPGTMGKALGLSDVQAAEFGFVAACVLAFGPATSTARFYRKKTKVAPPTRSIRCLTWLVLILLTCSACRQSAGPGLDPGAIGDMQREYTSKGADVWILPPTVPPKV